MDTKTLICDVWTNPIETLSSNFIFMHETPLPSEVSAFVYLSRNNNYHIFVNEFLNHDSKEKIFLHELKHITIDMPSCGYLIGLDLHKTPLELHADLFAAKALDLVYDQKSLK